jgi:LmbE family N-acetylglucosaminyl deacetylase
VPFTLVAFHAHPDDESLLMGGTIARAAAEGHRVVLVAATDGAAGLASAAGRAEELGRRRLAELERAAGVLGAARVVHLGFPDGALGSVDTASAAAALLAVVEAEGADVLTSYDPAGGYGHPDHVAVHRIARIAAVATPGLVVLEATVDRGLLLPAVRLVRAVPGAPPIDLDRMACSYLPRDEITHRVDVRRFVGAKVKALSEHSSQQTGGAGFRTVTLLRRLPAPVARLALGREWFREVGRTPLPSKLDDVFASCR